jgi:hypothetical protein
MARVSTGPAIAACLDIIGRGAVTVDELRTGMVALDGQLEPDEVTDFVVRLLRVGLLQTVAPVPEQSDDHLDALRAWLAGPAAPAFAALSGPVAVLRDHLASYAREHDPVRRLAGYGAIHDVAAGLFGTPGVGDGGGVPAKNVFHENAVFTEPVVEGNPRRWRPVLDDLGRLRSVLAAYAPNLAARRAVAAFFVDRYGDARRVPWPDFHRDLNRFLVAGDDARCGELTGSVLRELCAGPVFSPPHKWRALPFAAEIAELTDTLTAAVRTVPPDADGVIRVDHAYFEPFVATWPPWLRPVGSVAYYLQIVEADGDVVAVLNNATVGHGRGTSRLDRLLRLAGSGPGGGAHAGHMAGGAGADTASGRTAAPTADAGLLLAECDGAFGSNLNLRDLRLPYGLDFPFTTSGRTPERVVGVGELTVGVDPAGGVLDLRRGEHGPLVQVLQTGLMAEFFLPAPLRGLVELFGPAATLLHAGYPPFIPQGHDPRTQGAGRLDRVQVGTVVVARRNWVFPGHEVPARNRGEDDLAYWRRVAAWVGDHGLPERCYVRVLPTDGQAPGLDLKTRKPLYLDFSTWDLVSVLERVRGGPGDLIVISEALPDLSQAPRYGGDRHVTELIAEVTGD